LTDFALTAVDTRSVKGRRALRFSNFEQLLAEAERLADSDTLALGNWSLGQILKHLAVGMHMSIDGSPFDAHWLIRLVARLFVRRRLIHKRMSPGIRLPAAMEEQLVPGPTDIDEGLESLRAAIARMQRESKREPHPILGRMTLAEWQQFHLRHAELHLSYIVPA
jgi:hypothetical protein